MYDSTKVIVDSEVRGTNLQKLVDSEVRDTTLQKLIVQVGTTLDTCRVKRLGRYYSGHSQG